MALEDLENQQMVGEDYKAPVMKLSDIIIFLSGNCYLNKKVQIKVIFPRTASGRLYVSTCKYEIKNVTDDIVNSPGFENV